MGTSIGAIASPPIADFGQPMLEALMRCRLERWPGAASRNSRERFDTRNVGDVRITLSDKVLILENTQLCDGVLIHNDLRPYQRFVQVTGMLSRVVYFCIYDSGEHHGFSVLEGGRLVRHRLYNLFEGTTTRGDPLPVEREWQPAVLTDNEKQGLEPGEQAHMSRHSTTQALSHDDHLTYQLVSSVLIKTFGFCPHDGFVGNVSAVDECYRKV